MHAGVLGNSSVDEERNKAYDAVLVAIGIVGVLIANVAYVGASLETYALITSCWHDVESV